MGLAFSHCDRTGIGKDDRSDEEWSWDSGATSGAIPPAAPEQPQQAEPCSPLPVPCGGTGESRPQISRGRRIYPEHWGLSRLQVHDLLRRLRSEQAWSRSNTVHSLVHEFIVPWTARTGLGYALMLNEDEPKEVNVMISHCFSENAEEFLEAVVRATDDNDVVYICALANYQAEDGCGPTIMEQLGEHPTQSPFWRVLAHIAAQGAKAGAPWRWRAVLLRLPRVIALSLVVIACSPLWSPSDDFMRWFKFGAPFRSAHSRYYVFVCLCCLVGVVACSVFRFATRRLYPGRMVVVPNQNEDVYARLWCVYEIFVARTLGVGITVAPTLATAGRVSSKDAKCSSAEDQRRIRSEIESRPGGYRAIDRAVRRTVAGVQRHLVGLWAKYMVLQIVPPFTALSLIVGWPRWEGIVIIAATYGAWIALSFYVAKRMKGVSPADTASAAWLCVCVLVSCAVREGLFFARQLQPAGANPHIHLLWAVSFFLYEIAAVCVLPLAAIAQPFGNPLPVRCRLRLLITLFFLLLACSFLQPLLRPPHKLNNAIVIFACLETGSRLAPTYMTWTEMLHFGFFVDRHTPATPSARTLSKVGAWVWLLTTLEVPYFVLALCGVEFAPNDVFHWDQA